MKVLINTVHYSVSGGVSNHYMGLKNFWSYDINYNYIGSRFNIPGLVLFLYDYTKFFLKILFNNYDVIVLNPSLGYKALLRDSIYLLLSRFFNKKIIVFFHGWNNHVEQRISENPKIFSKILNNSDSVIVLSSIFKEKLLSWGVKKKIYLTTTKVDDNLLKNFDIIKNKRNNNTILFLSRIEKNKGIFIAIKCFAELKEHHKDLSMLVVGDGGALSNAKDYVKKNKIKDIFFKGHLEGVDLINSFRKSDIYLLPTFHGEGMPTSILEAMAFGLPVITRPVGGVNDFFKDGEMGFLVNSLDPLKFSKKTSELLNNVKLKEKIAIANYKYAKSNFYASRVANQLENIIKKLF